mgnify:CR=1 FL=1
MAAITIAPNTRLMVATPLPLVVTRLAVKLHAGVVRLGCGAQSGSSGWTPPEKQNQLHTGASHTCWQAP